MNPLEIALECVEKTKDWSRASEMLRERAAADPALLLAIVEPYREEAIWALIRRAGRELGIEGPQASGHAEGAAEEARRIRSSNKQSEGGEPR